MTNAIDFENLKLDLRIAVAIRARAIGLQIQEQPMTADHMALPDGRVLRLDLAPGFWRDVEANASAVLAAVVEMVEEVAEKHGPGAVWCLLSLPLVHLVDDDGQIEHGGRVRLRRLCAHEATALPAPPAPPAQEIEIVERQP